MAESLQLSTAEAAGDAELEVTVTEVQTLEVVVVLNDATKVEAVRAALEVEVCDGAAGCSVAAPAERRRRLAAAVTFAIVRELAGNQKLAVLPALGNRVAKRVAKAAGTDVEIEDVVVTKLEAAVVTAVEGEGGAERARVLEADLGAQLAAAAAKSTGVADAAVFVVDVEALMPPSPPPPNPPPPSPSPWPPARRRRRRCTSAAATPVHRRRRRRRSRRHRRGRRRRPPRRCRRARRRCRRRHRRRCNRCPGDDSADWLPAVIGGAVGAPCPRRRRRRRRPGLRTSQGAAAPAGAPGARPQMPHLSAGSSACRRR